jgi:hypothetical protein
MISIEEVKDLCSKALENTPSNNLILESTAGVFDKAVF